MMEENKVKEELLKDKRFLNLESSILSVGSIIGLVVAAVLIVNIKASINIDSNLNIATSIIYSIVGLLFIVSTVLFFISIFKDSRTNYLELDEELISKEVCSKKKLTCIGVVILVISLLIMLVISLLYYLFVALGGY